MTRSVMADVDLGVFAGNYPPEQRSELNEQTARARGLWDRLQQEDIPGVILGDEVGKGKTYIALALAFATLASRRRARVLILTHSKRMARTWAARWSQEVRQMVAPRWRERFDGPWAPRVVTRYEDFVAALEETARDSAVLFASYDTLKRFWNHDDRRRLLLGVLAHAYAAHRIRLGKRERLDLVKSIVADGGRMPSLAWTVDRGKAIQVLRRCFDGEARDWKPAMRRELEEFLDVEIGRSLVIQPRLDLLMVDEAHKLEGRRRGSVVTCLLSGRFRKGVWVTATPFALSLTELRHRLEQFEHVAGAPRDYRATLDALPLAEYQRAVSERADFPKRDALERGLRRQLVRSTWSHRHERQIVDWTRPATGPALLPSMALERVLANVLEHGQQTHVASLRETLCSSWAATLKSIETGALKRFAGDPWVGRLERALNVSVREDPKLRVAVEEIARLAAHGEKTVVFTHRTETSAVLVRELSQDPRMVALTAAHRRAAKRWRERAPRVQQALGVPTLALARVVAKVIAHSADAPREPTAAALRAWWRRHRKTIDAQARSAGATSRWAYLDSVAGSDRRLPVVVRFDGEVSGGDETQPDTVGNDQKFNLPCAPLVLIATRKGQEGIDLHHYCRRVVLYDLPWNPALIEQRIGRVHRLGGLRSRTRPVEVVYCYQQGSYEELIAARVKRRCEMMHALLGAGTWLEQDREVVDLDRYRMTFPPGSEG